MMSHDTVREATRLTQAGRLAEATALLQRMLRSQSAPASSPVASTQVRLPPPLAIELEASDVRVVRPALSETVAVPRRRPPLFDRAKDGTWLGLRGIKRAPASMTDIVPEGANFTEGTYSDEAGSRTYKLFVPTGYRSEPMPLIVMLHGCTQSPDDFAAGTRMNFIAEEQNCLVVYPAQRRDANPSKCWNWFRRSDQHRGSGEPSLIAGITRQVMQEYTVDPQRVFVAGLSAGGAAAAVMGATYSDLYAAVGIHSGLAHGAATDMASAFAAMRQGRGAGGQTAAAGPMIPTIVFHGDHDSTVHPDNGAQAVEQAIGATETQKHKHRGQIPGGRAYTRTVYTLGAHAILEHWSIHGGGHAWSGGSPAGSFTDSEGPDATREMLRFFLDRPHPK